MQLKIDNPKIIPSLCACGCGEEVKRSKKNKNKWNKYIDGHQSRGSDNPGFGKFGKDHHGYGKSKYKAEKEKPAPLCNCGCGENVRWDKGQNKWNKFINGHSGRGVSFFGFIKTRSPFCACGCGEKVKWNKYKSKWNIYITGHNSNGKKRSNETRRRLSIALTGRVLTEETRKKISICHLGNTYTKGRKVSEETRKKISLANTGRIPNTETRNKMSISRMGNTNAKGMVVTEETCRKLSIALIGKYTGANNWNWRGGVATKPYCDAWRDKEYKQDIKERDGNKCQNSECWGKCNHLPLHIHHIDHNKEKCSPSNLITLCGSCNSRANANREYWEKLYQGIMIKNHGYEYDLQASV